MLLDRDNAARFTRRGKNPVGVERLQARVRQYSRINAALRELFGSLHCLAQNPSDRHDRNVGAFPYRSNLSERRYLALPAHNTAGSLVYTQICRPRLGSESTRKILNLPQIGGSNDPQIRHRTQLSLIHI